MTDDYEVGYRKPPKRNQFKKGQSGNPKGRPKGAKNLRTDLEEELRELIVVREGGTSKTVSKRRAMLKSLTAKAVQGDTRAAAIVIDMMYRLLHEDEAEDPHFGPTLEDKAILEAHENRILRKAESAPEDKDGGKTATTHTDGENHEQDD